MVIFLLVGAVVVPDYYVAQSLAGLFEGSLIVLRNLLQAGVVEIFGCYSFPYSKYHQRSKKYRTNSQYDLFLHLPSL